MRRARLNDICCWVVTENWLRRMTQRESRFREEGLSMRNAAVMAMISLSAIGFAVADGKTWLHTDSAFGVLTVYLN